MIRALLRFIVVLVIVVAAAAFFFGYRWGGMHFGRTTPAPAVQTERPVGTVGGDAQSARDRARATGAEIGEKVAVGTEKAAETLDEARLTAKVKSKMALDDTLKGSDVAVHTTGTVVTVEGRVFNAAQHQRVLRLVRETEGVTDVVDRLSVR